ncbi:acyltransferase [Actinomycetota bacterium]|nr:acyltransferase [Actinomycetota bacterium]
MRSANRPYMYTVDHLRAGAAILVLLYHATRNVTERMDPALTAQSAQAWMYSKNPAVTVILEGHTGVALFMVLSGFIFTVGTNGEEVRYWPYLHNRLLRIYPLYAAILVVGLSASPTELNLKTLALAVFPIGNLSTLSELGWWGAMFWAVAVEVQFYLVFPFLLRFLNRRGPLTLVKIICAMLVLRSLAVLSQPGAIDINHMTYSSLAGRLDQFILGMLAAWAFTNHRRVFSSLTLALSAVAAVAMMWVFNQTHWFADPQASRVIWVDIEGLIWATFIASYVAVFERFRGRATRLLAKLGETSYSIYLLHVVVIGWIVAHPGMWIHVGGSVTSGFATGALVVLPLTVVVAFFTYNGIEKPFLSMRGTYRKQIDTPEDSSTEDGGTSRRGRRADVLAERLPVP